MSARQPDPTLIDELPFTEVAPTLRIMGDAGISDEDAQWIRGAGNAAQLRAWIRNARGADHVDPIAANPYAISVTETVRRLQEMSDICSWSLPKRSVAQLFASAPPWPKGPLAFRSLRLRFGANDPVQNSAYWNTHGLLIAHGSSGRTAVLIQNHELFAGSFAVPNRGFCLEWVCFTLDPQGSPSCSHGVLGDEVLTFAWLFPEYVAQIDRRERPALLMPGYLIRRDGVPGIPFIDKQDDNVVLSQRPEALGTAGGFALPRVLP